MYPPFIWTDIRPLSARCPPAIRPIYPPVTDSLQWVLLLALLRGPGCPRCGT